MKMRNVGVLLFVLLQSLCGFGQEFAGTWKGDLNAGGMRIPLVIHIQKSESGLAVSADSPTQGAYNLPGKIEVIADSLSISLDAGIAIRGRLANDTTIQTTFYQGNTQLPLSLIRQNASNRISKLNRPQEPQPPYPYNSEDFQLTKDEETSYGGTVTSPGKEGKYPAVILISGSGQQNRDSELFGHKPFKVLADYLTKNEFVVLRFDDLGVGQSKGDLRNFTTLTQAADISFLLDYLAQHPKVDRTKIGLIGHSEGGVIAPIVAAHDDRVRYVVSLAGMAVTGYELSLRQRKDFNSEIPPAKEKFYSDLLDVMQAEGSQDNIRAEMQRKVDAFAATEQLTGQDTVALSRLFTPWFITFVNLDPAIYLDQLDIPVMALNGGKDVQVIAEDNLRIFEQHLPKRKENVFKTYPLLNHLFQTASKGALDEYVNIEETFNEQVLKDMADWLKER
jgi:pimeloyl-ACP methyl ester carboxylesterase